MSLQFATKNGMVLIQVTGMSTVFKEEFFEFRRKNTGNPREGQEGSEGTKADDFVVKGEVHQELTYYYKGYFNEAATNKIVEWLKEKGAESAKED